MIAFQPLRSFVEYKVPVLTDDSEDGWDAFLPDAKLARTLMHKAKRLTRVGDARSALYHAATAYEAATHDQVPQAARLLFHTATSVARRSRFSDTAVSVEVVEALMVAAAGVDSRVQGKVLDNLEGQLMRLQTNDNDKAFKMVRSIIREENGRGPICDKAREVLHKWRTARRDKRLHS